MLAARVEPKNGPKENKEIGNFKPLVLSQFQAAVDIRALIRDEIIYQCMQCGAETSKFAEALSHLPTQEDPRGKSNQLP